MLDEAVICVKCGRMVETAPNAQQIFSSRSTQKTGLSVAAEIFMIIGTVIKAILIWILPLAWCLPMTISYFKKVQNGEPVSTGFKVCSMLFVSLLGGILMLCDQDR